MTSLPPPVTNRRKRAIGWQSRDIVRAAALAMALFFGAKLFWYVSPLFLTAFIGVLFGLAVSSGVDQLRRWRVPRGVGAPLIVVTFLGALVAFGAVVAPTLRSQGAELQRKLPESIDRLDHWISVKQQSSLGLIGRSGSTTSAAPDSSSPPRTAVDSSTDLRTRIGSEFGNLSKYFFQVLSSTVEIVAGMLLIIFMSIYIAADPGLYHRGLIAIFPHRHRARVGEVLSAIGVVLRRWLVTQLIAMVTLGVVTTIVLMVLGVKAAGALGVIAGLLEFVPTLGPLLSAIPAIAMAFLDSPEKAATVAVAYVGIHFLENHILIPLLMKGGINLPPVLTILAQALMALLFGFLGLMTAVPLLAAVTVAVRLLLVNREMSVSEIIGERHEAEPA